MFRKSNLPWVILTLISLSFLSAHARQTLRKQKRRILQVADATEDKANDLTIPTATVRRKLEEEKEKNEQARYLVIFDSVGKTSVLGTIRHSVEEHFSSPDWHCMVFVHVDETTVGSDNQDFVKISDMCAVLRIPGFNWGQWLQIVTPTLNGSYERVAIHLDDIYLPSKGDNKVSVPELLTQMEKHDLASISPAIDAKHVDHNHSTRPKKAPMSKCLAEVEMIEINFQIFSRNAWKCFHSQLHHENSKGYCYDKCYAHHCSGLNAVDYRMVGYHLDSKAWHQIPIAGKLNQNFVDSLPEESGDKDDADVEGFLSHCKAKKCDTRFDKWQTIQYPLSCDDLNEDERTSTPHIMHIYDDGLFDQALVKFWSDSWIEAGWNVRVLTIEDAKKSPDYEYINEVSGTIIINRVKLHMMKYLAMSTVPEGGWITNPHFFPLYPVTGRGSGLPNDGRLTFHDSKFLGLISGTQSEFERFVRFVVEKREGHPVYSFYDLQKEHFHAFHFEDNVVSSADYSQVQSGEMCEIAKGDNKAVLIHMGYTLTALKAEGIISEASVASYAKVWTEEFRHKCWEAHTGKWINN